LHALTVCRSHCYIRIGSFLNTGLVLFGHLYPMLSSGRIAMVLTAHNLPRLRVIDSHKETNSLQAWSALEESLGSQQPVAEVAIALMMMSGNDVALGATSLTQDDSEYLIDG